MNCNLPCPLMANLWVVVWVALALSGSDVGAHDSSGPGRHEGQGSTDDEPSTPATATATLDKPDQPTSSSFPTQLVRCEKADDVMPYWSDSNCRTYFVCEKQVPYLHTCPMGQAFSAELNQCVHWDRVSCSAQNKAVWLAMEAATLIRESSSPSQMLARSGRGETGGGPKQMIDTRGLAHKLRDPGLEKIKRLQGLLRHQGSWADRKVDVSAYSGPIITVQLPLEICSSTNNRQYNPAQTSSLLNTVLQAETGCPGKPADCRLPYLDVHCETSGAGDNEGGAGVNRGQGGVNRGQGGVNRGQGGVNRGQDAPVSEERHVETEVESVNSKENLEKPKGDQGGDSSATADSSRFDGDNNHIDGSHKHSSDNDTPANNNNNNNNDDQEDGLKESKTRFSVWSTDYSNGYEIEDTNTEIHFPEDGHQRSHFGTLEDEKRVNEIQIKQNVDGSKVGEKEAGDGRTTVASDKSDSDGRGEGRNLFADSDLFALRDHIERKIRESLHQTFASE